jgi:nicotinamidase-related amidase
MKTALVLIDIQNDYFPGGAMELVGSEGAGLKAGELLAAAREKGAAVYHVQHISVQPGATFFVPGTGGMEINPCVAPRKGEQVVTKNFPNSFRATALESLLKEQGVERIVFAGMMTHMCVDATVRAAFDMGYTCAVAHDACATRALLWEGTGAEIAAPDVHGSFMTALGAVYAKVDTAGALAELFT